MPTQVKRQKSGRQNVTHGKKLGLLALGLSYVLIVFMLLGYIGLNSVSPDKSLPNLTYKGLTLGSKSLAEIQLQITQHFPLAKSQKFNYENQVIELPLEDLGLRFDPQLSKKIFNYGRGADPIKILADLTTSRLEQFPLYEVQTDKLISKLQEQFYAKFPGKFFAPRDSKLTRNDAGAVQDCQVSQLGNDLDYTDIVNLITRSTPIITLDDKPVLPPSRDKQLDSACTAWKLFKENVALQLGAKQDQVGDSVKFSYGQVAGASTNLVSLSPRISVPQQVFRFDITNVQQIKNILTDYKLRTDKPSTSHIEIIGDRAVLLAQSGPAEGLDVEATIANLSAHINDAIQHGSIELIYSTQRFPSTYEGRPVMIFPQHLAKGNARVPLAPSVRVANIRKGLDNLNGYVIRPNSEFSLIDALDAKVYDVTGDEERVVVNGGTIAYGGGICGVSTVTFRAAVLAGLPITERHSHVKGINNYSYPYGGIFDAALYFDKNITQDLKFYNDSRADLFIKTDYWAGDDGYFYYEVNIYADSNFQKRNVELGQFSRTSKTKLSGFSESFSVTVDGVSKEYKSRYYKSDF